MSPATPEVIEERVKQLEAREDKQDGQIADLEDVAADIREQLAAMRGELRGALSASRTGGAVIASLITMAGSAAIGLLIFLLGRK